MLASALASALIRTDRSYGLGFGAEVAEFRTAREQVTNPAQ